jgi:hypothetical protein
VCGVLLRAAACCGVLLRALCCVRCAAVRDAWEVSASVSVCRDAHLLCSSETWHMCCALRSAAARFIRKDFTWQKSITRIAELMRTNGIQ